MEGPDPRPLPMHDDKQGEQVTIEYPWGTYHETATRIWVTVNEGAWK